MSDSEEVPELKHISHLEIEKEMVHINRLLDFADNLLVKCYSTKRKAEKLRTRKDIDAFYNSLSDVWSPTGEISAYYEKFIDE